MFAFVGTRMAKLYQSYATMLWVATIVILQPVLCNGTNKYSESDAAKFLERVNRENTQRMNRVVKADWNWSTNLTNENAEKMSAIDEELGDFLEGMFREMEEYPWTTYKDANIKRQFKLFAELKSVALPHEKKIKFDEIVSAMEDVYIKATVPEYGKKKSNRRLSLEPDLINIMATSHNEEKLKHAWIQWRNATGKKIKHLYPEYVKLSNEASRLNNFTDTSEYWISEYEVDDFREQLVRVWSQVKPLYFQLHAYVRRRLWERYSSQVILRRGPIPAHLLGDMWTESWEQLGDSTLPFPEIEYERIDPTSAMKIQNYTAKKIFKLAEKFFTSMNLNAMPHTFWEKSILEKPSGRDIICQASAWDFYDSKDYRIKQCTTIDFGSFLTAHHEMGHIQYFQEYKDQPYIYREGPIDGFHEAVGDTIALSASTQKHLHKIGLMPEIKQFSSLHDVNYLYRIALDKLVFLPFGYLVDLWRWNVFKGITTKDTYNCDWWELRYVFQGIHPPVVRNENDFDPGAKYHIIDDAPFISHFVSYIIQFQFQQALCEKAGQYDPNDVKSKPLHECDISQSTKAGNALREMMKLGSSKPWYDAMELLTGQREINATPLLNYFEPLRKWLEKENRRTGELIGWESTRMMCTAEGSAMAEILAKNRPRRQV